MTIGIGLGIDLQGGNGGDGGTVSVDTTGNIGTEGPNAIGIFAQSVGGGGGVSGNLGFSPASEQALIGSVGGNGAGGAVDVTYTGSLTTAGGGAHGIFAQSAGGSGSGTVTVDVTGSVAASGSEAAGIFAQSVKLDSLATGTVGGDKINITLADGSQVQGGTPGVNNEAPGVLILDGTDNLLMTGASMLSNAKALAGDMSGYAIIATTGNDAVVNNGVILGSVDLGSGANTLSNEGSGILYSGTQLNVGAGNTFTNFGLLSPGGDEVLQTTALTGNLVQATGGNYLVTLDGAQVNVNDRVDVSGTADLAGTVQVQVIDAGTSTAPNQTTIIQSTGGVSAATAQNLTVQPSAVGNFGLVFSNPQKVDLTYAIDFSTPALAAGLNANQEAVADYLEALQGAGQIESEQLFLLEAEDTSAYAEALDQLSPEPYAVSSWAVALSAQQFSDALLSCREREGDARFIREGQCFRIGLQGRHFERDGSNDDIGYDIDAGEISLGAQQALSERWQLGAAVAYEYWRAEADDDIWRNTADQFQGGVVLKHQIGGTALSAGLNGGFGDVDIRRDATPTATAKGDQDVAFVGGQLRAAHAIEFGAWYLKPRSDLNVAWVHTDDVNESGAGAASLDVEDDRQTYIAVQPALEVGGEFATDGGYLLRPRASIGLTHFLKDPSPTAQARFATAPAGPAFAATSDVERTWLDLEVGVDVLSTRGINVGLSGFTQLADNAYQLGGALRLTIPF